MAKARPKRSTATTAASASSATPAAVPHRPDQGVAEAVACLDAIAVAARDRTDPQDREAVLQAAAILAAGLKDGSPVALTLTETDNAFVGFVHLDDAAFARLEKDGGITLDWNARQELDRIVGDYARLGQYRSLIDKDQLHILSDIVTHGREFARALEAAQEHPALAALLVLDRSMLNELAAHSARNAIRRYAVLTRERVEHAAKELKSLEARPKKHRAPPGLVTNKLLADLMGLYRAQGGHVGISEKSKGPFASFLAALWPHLPEAYKPKSPQALIRRASDLIAKGRRRSPGA